MKIRFPKITAGFGLETLGLVALRFPRATLLIVLAVTLLLAVSTSRIGFSSDIREIFRSDSPDFIAYQKVSEQYPSSGRDILLEIEGPGLFSPETLEKLRILHLDLNFIEGVDHVLSMFSARQAPDEKGDTAPIFPADLGAVKDVSALQRKARTHPLVANKLLSKEGELAVFVIALRDQRQSVQELRGLIAEVEDMARETLSGTGLKVGLTGLAVMRVEIIGSLRRDQRMFGIAGFAVGLIFCWLVFRSLSYVVIAAAPAAAAIIWLLGTMQLMGQEINVLTNVVTPMVLVIVLCDALHLSFGIRRNLQDGLPLKQAIATAVRRVGPACVLTSLTTTIALLSLTLVPHPFIAGFGYTAALGTAIAYIATITTLPAMAFLLLRRFSSEASARRDRDPIAKGIGAFCRVAARAVSRHPRVFSVIGVLTLGLAGLLYAQNEPRYQYREHLPSDSPAFRAITALDEKLAGTDTVLLLIQWPDRDRLDTPQTLELVRAAHEILEAEPLFRDVWSLRNVQDWFVQGGRAPDDLFAFLEQAESPLTSRVISPSHNSTLVIANFAGVDASVLLPVLDRVTERLRQLGKRYDGVELELTGVVAVSARAGYEMIGQLNRSLLAAIVVIIVLIGLALRSVMAGLVSILPNLLPICVAGACLYLFDKGLQFTSVVAFTIGFGIAVDDTIHVLNRYRLKRDEGLVPKDALAETISHIGPVLIVSTIVLVSGLGATMFSELPMMRLFGQMAAVVLITAVIGDMIFLPAILRVIEDWRGRRRDGSSR